MGTDSTAWQQLDDTEKFKANIAAALEPGEVLVWCGRPAARRRILLRTLPHCALGLGMAAFIIFWMISVALHGLGHPPPGQVVRPMEPANLMQAASGLLLLIPATFLIASPLWFWWKFGRTCYALTNKTVLIFEAGPFRHMHVCRFPAESLRLMRVENRSADGSGDLVFEYSTKRFPLPWPAGFLGLSDVDEVESLVRRTLPLKVGGASAPAKILAESDRSNSGSTCLTCRATASFWASQLVALTFFGVCAFCIAGFAVFLVFLAYIAMATPIDVGTKIVTMAKSALTGVPVPLTFLFTGAQALGMLLVTWFLYRTVFWTPAEIRVENDGTVVLRCWGGSLNVPAAELLSIRSGEWLDINHVVVVLEHKGGRIRFFRSSFELDPFVAKVQQLNPALKISGW